MMTQEQKLERKQERLKLKEWKKERVDWTEEQWYAEWKTIWNGMSL